MHMAIGAVVNALWDLYAKREGKPLWKLLADFDPEQLVDLVDFRYLTDVLTRDEALAILRPARAGAASASNSCWTRDILPIRRRRAGWATPTTRSPGWSPRRSPTASRTEDQGGCDIDDDVRRVRMVRDLVGPDVRIRSTPTSAGTSPRRSRTSTGSRRSGSTGSRSRPARTTSSATARSPRACIRCGWPPASTPRTGSCSSSCSPAEAIDGLPDRRLPGRRRQREHRDPAARGEVRRAGVPARRRRRAVRDRPAPGDVRLPRRQRQHRRPWIEYVDHLHEHFADPVDIVEGHYRAPSRPGTGAEILRSARADYRYPDGPIWAARNKQPHQTTPAATATSEE